MPVTDTARCDRCGHGLEVLRKPVRRLRWTRYWWEGFKSLFGRPLRHCSYCGAIYSADGNLVAAGAIETEAERRLNVYRRDMSAIRDSFAGVVIGAQLLVIYFLAGAEGATVTKIVLAGGVATGALASHLYFGRKARLARRDLKRMRAARRSGQIPSSGGPASGS